MRYYIPALILILVPALSLAAASDFNSNQIQIPQPILDLFHTFGQIHINVGQNQLIQGAAQDLQETVSQVSQNPQNLGFQARNLWMTVNYWLQSHIGVSLSQILTVIGGVFVWFFELMIKLIKLALPGVQ